MLVERLVCLSSDLSSVRHPVDFACSELIGIAQVSRKEQPTNQARDESQTAEADR